jgi:phosphoenolpyruvate carboxykinase (ATP)
MNRAGPFNPGRDAVTDKTVWWDNNKAIRRKTFNVLHADMLAQAKGMELYARIFMAAPDGSSLYICALTASKLAWAA